MLPLLLMMARPHVVERRPRKCKQGMLRRWAAQPAADWPPGLLGLGSLVSGGLRGHYSSSRSCGRQVAGLISSETAVAVDAHDEQRSPWWPVAATVTAYPAVTPHVAICGIMHVGFLASSPSLVVRGSSFSGLA